MAETGSTGVSPRRTTTYELTASDGAGGTKTARLTVQVSKDITEASAPTISVLVAKPNQIEEGERTLLGWRTSGATSVELRPGGKVALSGSQEIKPLRSTRYTLIARNSQGSTAEKSVTVTVKQTSSSRIHTRGQTVIQGNWLCDLDSGKGRRSREGSDFFWQDRTKQRLLVPYNNARFRVLGRENFDSVSLDDLRRMSYSGDRIEGSNSRRNRLPTGTVVAAVTSDRRYCKFRIDKYGSDLKITWVTYAR